MKRLILTVVISAFGAGLALADRPAEEQKTQKDNADWEYVTLTGSHIKQKVRKRNIITEGSRSHVITIDQREMERNGNGQLADQLSHYPGIQISRH